MEIRIRVLPLAVLCAVLVSGLGAGSARAARGAGNSAGAVTYGSSSPNGLPPTPAPAPTTDGTPAPATVAASATVPVTTPVPSSVTPAASATPARATASDTISASATAPAIPTTATVGAAGPSPTAVLSDVVTAPLPTTTSEAGDLGASAPPLTASVVVSSSDGQGLSARQLAAYGRLPLSLEANRGQADPSVRFVARTAGATLFLTGADAVLALTEPGQSRPLRGRTAHARPASSRAAVVRLHAVGTNPAPAVVGLDQLPGAANYFIGSDPAGWTTGIPTYRRVAYRGVYPGVDLVYYGTAGRLEYDWELAPGVDPRLIQLQVGGTQGLRLDRRGALELPTSLGTLRQALPVVYQVVDGRRRDIGARYALTGTDRVGFDVGAYDPSQPLIIDPVLGYSTYLGGSGYDAGYGVTVDGAGAAYVTGSTDSANFPTAGGQGAYGGDEDAFVAKLNPSGSALVYSTYIGGSGDNGGNPFGVDSSGAVYITGWTNSTNFPTVNALQSAYGGGPNDAFLTKLNAAGNALLYSTYLGGSGDDQGLVMALDASGAAYITGETSSTNFITTTNALQGSYGGGPYDAFVAKINTAASGSASLVYSTYLGGSGDDQGWGIAVDGAGNASLTGLTSSTNFRTVGALQGTYGGGAYDAFVTKLNASGSAALYSTYLGGSGDDQGSNLALDGSGAAYITGKTSSTNFITTTAALQGSYGGGPYDAFVTKLNTSGGGPVYSTYLGGSGDDQAWGIAVDGSGAAYVAGQTSSANFPLANAIQAANGGGTYDAFVTKLNAGGGGPVYSTYLGGSGEDDAWGLAVDGSGSVYVTGQTASADFPTTSPLQGVSGGGSDAFVAKLGDLLITTVAGNGTAGYSGVGGRAAAAQINGPCGLAVDAAGNLFIADQNNNVVQEVLASSGVITTVVGYTTTAGFSGDGGAATQALLNTPCGVAVDGAGNLFIGDQNNNRVREVIASTGVITTVAGTGVAGFGGDGGAAAQALLNSPRGVALDNAGNLFIGDWGNNRVREIVASSGVITTVAGSGVAGFGGDGGPATQAQFNGPGRVSLDSGGDMFITDYSNNRVREVIAGTGVITTVAGYTTTAGFSGDGGPPTQAQLNSPRGVVVDGAGNLFIGDQLNNRVREVFAATGIITTVAGTGACGYGGDGGAAMQAQLCKAGALAMDSAGNLFVADFANHRVREVGGIGVRLHASSGDIPWHPHHGVRFADGLGASVDLADGHLDVTARDLRVAGRGPDLTFGHTWDSTLDRLGAATAAGQGWVTDLTPRMGGALTHTVTYTDTTGAVWPFVYNGGPADPGPYISYSTPAGLPWQLTASAAAYTLTNILTGEALRFDAQGRYQSDSDAYGNSNTLAYGGAGPITDTNSGGRSLALSYQGSLLGDARSPLWRSSGGAQGQRVTYGYQGDQLTALTWGAGTSDALTASFGYSGTQLISATTPYTQGAHTWSIGYDGQGRVTTLTSPASGTVGQAGYTPAYTTTIGYGVGQTQVVAGAGTTGALTSTYTLDAQGEATAMTDGLGHTTRTSYDADHDVVSGTDANGATTTNSYQYVGPNGAVGLRTRTVQPPVSLYAPGNAPSQPQTTNTYDPATYDLLETDKPEGGVTKYGYDGHHGVITTTEQTTGNTCATACPVTWRGTLTAYDQYGERTSATDGRGVSVDTSGKATLNGQASAYTGHLGYDAQGDLISESTPPITTTLNGLTTTAPVTTTDGYDGDGNRVSATTPNGNTTTYTYDHLGRPVQTTLPPVRLWSAPYGVPSTGVITTVAGNGVAAYGGDGGPATAASLNSNNDMAVDAAGNLYIADESNNRVREVIAGTGVITTVAGTGTAGYSGDGGPATGAQLNGPIGLAFDWAGNLFVAECNNGDVREILAGTGVITTVAGIGGSLGYNGDNIPARQAQLNGPRAVAVDPDGNLYIGDYVNDRVREVVARTGVITTVAGTGSIGYSGDGGPATGAQLNGPIGVVRDGAGNLFIADRFNNRVRAVAAGSGVITTVAGTGAASYGGDGGPATTASLNSPWGLALDGANNLYIGDEHNNVVREVLAATGVITTVAGYTTTAGYGGDGGPARQALLNAPTNVRTDQAGDLYIADTNNNRVREVSAGVALNSGGAAVGRFQADAFYSGGSTYATGNAVDTSGAANPAPQAVYQSERYGNVSYTTPNLTPGGQYIVRLHFAEIFHSGVGQRVFNVAINGAAALTNFDIVATAGGANKAVVEEFPAVADGSGRVTVAFTTVVDNAKVSGIEIAPATRPTETMGYDGEGNAVSSTDANGHSTTSSYDPLGRLVSETNPVSGTSVISYNATEQTATQDPQGNVTGYGYDAAGRQIQVTNPATGTVQTAYDAAGNTLAMTTTDRTNGNAVVTLDQLGYDALNRVITSTVVTNTANIAGSALTTLTAYDGDGNVAQTQQPRGDIVYNVYDAADQLQAVEIDPAPLTKGQAATHPRYEAYGYDQAGNQTVSVDADNRTTTTQYDGAGRLTQSVAVSYPPTGTTTITTTLGYDPDGNTLRQTTQTVDSTSPGQTQTHTTTSAYNAADWETSSSVDGLGTSYTYDAAGQQIGVTTSDGQTGTTLAYDAAGRVTALAENANGAGPYTTAYSYNANDLPQTLAYPNGVTMALGYDANSQLTTLSATGPAQTPTTTTLASGYAYGYNAAGWITSATTLSGTDVITHDASGRLTDECGPQVTTPNKCAHWTYDANGNLLTATDDTGSTDVYTYSVTQINAQVAGGSSTSPPTATIRLAYDGHGDTTSISNPVSLTPNDPGYQKYALAESFVYDAQQRPITVTRLVADKVNGQTLVTPLTATMQYNADGLRSDYYLTPDPRTGKQPVDTRFAYRDGQLASATVTGITGTLLYKNTFLYGPGGEPLELIRTNPDGTTSRYWYVLDGLGSVVALTDQSGKVVNRYAYDSWGEETSNDAVSETVPQQLRYAGYYYDEKLTWYWVMKRYYDPEAMRWLQPDPSDHDGIRTYTYVDNDPVDATDPTGCCRIVAHFEPPSATSSPFGSTNRGGSLIGKHTFITLNDNNNTSRYWLYQGFQVPDANGKGHLNGLSSNPQVLARQRDPQHPHASPKFPVEYGQELPNFQPSKVIVPGDRKPCRGRFLTMARMG